MLCLALALALADPPLPDGAFRRVGGTKFRHTGPVNGVAVSADGTTVYSTDDRAVSGWDATTGKLLFRTAAEVERIGKPYRVGVGAGQVWVLCGLSGDGFVVARLDPKTGRVVGRGRTCHRDGYDGLGHTADGTRLLLRAQVRDGPVELVAFATAGDAPPVVLPPPAGRSFCLTPEGSAVAVGTGSNVVRLYSTDTGKVARELTADTDAVVEPVAFAPDGTRLLTASGADDVWAVELRDAATGKRLRTIADRQPTPYPPVVFAPDGKRLAVEIARRGQVVFDADTGKELYDLPTASRVAFSADGKTLVTVPTDAYTFTLRDAATGLPRASDAQPVGVVHRLRITDDNRLLGIADGCVVSWDAATGGELGRSKPLPNLSAEYPSYSAFNRAGTRLVYLAGDDVTRVHLFDLTKHVPVADIQSSTRYPFCRFNPAGDLVVPDGKRMRMLDALTGREKATIPTPLGRDYRGYESAFDGRLLSVVAENSGDETGVPDPLQVIEVGTGRVLFTLRCEDPGVMASSFAPDGRTLVASGTKGTVHGWDLVSGRRLWARKLADDPILGSLMFADGRTVAVVAPDRSIQLLEVSTGRVRRALVGHEQPVSSFDVSRDGRTIAVASPDGPVILWDVRGEGIAAGPPPDAAGWERWWTDLKAEDAKVGVYAVRTFARHPAGGVPALAARLKPVPPADAARIAGWVADLESPKFTVRESAARELSKLGELAEPALRAATASPSAEVRDRAAGMLESLPPPTPEDVRLLRAVEALEWAGTTEAKALLRTLASGADGARLTRAAKGAAGRMK